MALACTADAPAAGSAEVGREPRCGGATDRDGDRFPDVGTDVGGRCRRDECPAKRARSSQNGCPLARDPVRLYAPLVWLHPDEPYLPLGATAFIRRSRLVWSTPSGSSIPIDAEISDAEIPKLGAECELLGSGCYRYDEVTPPRSSYEHTRPYDGGRREGFVLEHTGPTAGTGTAAPAYYVYRPGKYVAYWFHYAYSRHLRIFSHQGDWEHVAILLDEGNLATGLEYFFHRCHKPASLDPAERPEIYSAKRSHATYLTARTHYGGCSGRDVTKKGRKWDTRAQLIDAEAEPWYGFGGAWGKRGDRSDATGPLGPSPYKKNCTNCDA
jgi:hypothetical protein